MPVHVQMSWEYDSLNDQHDVCAELGIEGQTTCPRRLVTNGLVHRPGAAPLGGIRALSSALGVAVVRSELFG